jgi:predicted dehydrogenase
MSSFRDDDQPKAPRDGAAAADTETEQETASGAAGTSRRDFFRLAGAAGLVAGALGAAEDAVAGPLPAPKANLKKFTGGKFPKAPVMATGRVLGANDRIVVAHIGVGGMGNGHLQNIKKNAKEWNIQQAAVCDVYQPRLERARGKLMDGEAEAVTVMAEKDYRRILENKDIDAVIIASPEHWHCQMGVHALQAGKHAYVEKPMSRYLDEAFQLYDAWKKTSLTVQVGSHGCSDPKYHAARQVLASGRLGPLVTAQSSYTRNAGTKGEWNYNVEMDAGPENLDWAAWLGSAAKRPWNDDSRERFFRYRKYRDYSAGILGDLMPHRIHPIFLALNSTDWPTKVQCIGTKKISTDREVSDTVNVIAEMESGWSFVFLGSTVNEQGLQEVIRGHKATLYLAGTTPEVKPERPYAEEVEAGPVPVEDSGENHVKHERNFFESIRAGKQPNCNMELAIRAQTLVCLAEISELTGRSVGFDQKKRVWKFV